MPAFLPYSASEPRLPAAAICTVRARLQTHSADRPHAVFAAFASGRTWSYDDLHARVRTLAAHLQALEVRPGDRVLCWLPNGAEALLVLLAANYIGAVYAPVGVEARGPLLENAIGAVQARVAVVHSKLLPRLSEGRPGFRNIAGDTRRARRPLPRDAGAVGRARARLHLRHYRPVEVCAHHLRADLGNQ
jgi:acyl-CoA synthetase (AMP-forming)/AMP-acid ligase II